MAESFDVVVVGAGPSGSLASLVLARAGRKVALIDKARFPRTKVCGDCVNPGCWEIWDRYGLTEGFEQLPHHQVTGIDLQWEGKTIYERALEDKSRMERAVMRETLDDWLCRSAVESGVRFFPETHVMEIRESQVRTNNYDFEARFVVGADGRNSQVAKLAGLAASTRNCGRVAWQTHFSFPEMDSRVHMNLFDTGYYGITRVDQDQVNLCMVLNREAATTPQKTINRFFRDLPALTWKSVYPISRPRAKLTNGRVWLTGDAARLVEPFTGQGIYFALASGELLGKTLVQATEAKTMGPAMAEYARSHDQIYAGRMQVNQLTRWCTEKPWRAGMVLKTLRRFPNMLDRLVEKVQNH